MLIGKRPTWLPLTLAVVALSLVFAEGAAAKCSSRIQVPGLGPNESVLLLDGSIVPSRVVEGQIFAEGLDEIDPSTIHSVELTCWNPATGEFGGGVVGVPIILVLSKGLVESTRAPIEALLRAQKAYFSEHSRYAQSLDDLGAFGVSDNAMLELSVTSAGWSASTPRDGVAYRCFVFSGATPQELAGTKEHEVVCQPEAAKALRAMYEGSG